MPKPQDRQTRDKNNYTVVPQADQTIRLTETRFNIKDVDAYGRLQTTSPNILFEAYFTDSNKPILFATSTSAGDSVTRNATTASMKALTGTALGERAIFQTRQYIHNTPCRRCLRHHKYTRDFLGG